MEFNEAFTHAKGMNRFFHAFAWLEEVLKVAAGAERAVAEASTRKAVLEKEITALSTSGGRLRIEVEELEESLITFKAHAASFEEGKRELLKEFLNETEATRARAVAKAQASVSVVEVEAQEAKRRVRAEIAELRAEYEEVKGVLQKARADLAALHRSTGGLG